MKKVKFHFLVLIIFMQGIALSATIEEIKYNNKTIPVIFEKNKQLPIFNLQLVFKNSGYILDKKKHGLTSLVAKVLNEGTKSDGSVKFARKLESKAISIHTQNGFETFVIEVSCLKSEYKKALKFLNSLLQDPNISNKTLDKLKIMIKSKIKQKENDFDYIASKELKSLIFKDTALEHGSIGTIDSIDSIVKKDIKKQINNIFNINNLIIVASGDIELQNLKDDMKPLLVNFNDNKTKDANSIVASSKPIDKTIIKQTQQAYIYFASPFDIKYNDKNIYKSKVASFILGGSGFGSRLMEEIRVKRGLAYSTYGHIVNQKTHTYFTGHLQTKLENTKEAKKLVKEIVNEFITNGVTLDELNAAKKFLLGSEPLRTETTSQRQSRAFSMYYKGFEQSYPQDELNLIENLTLEDLNKFIKSHQEINKLSFAIVTDKKGK